MKIPRLSQFMLYPVNSNGKMQIGRLENKNIVRLTLAQKV